MEQENHNELTASQKEWKAPKYKESLAIKPMLQAEIKQQEARQAATDKLKADEVRRSIGLPTRELPSKPKTPADLFAENLESSLQSSTDGQQKAREVIQQRLDSLNSQQIATERIIATVPSSEKLKYDQFIGNQAGVDRGRGYEYYLDDQSVYLDFADTLSEIKGQIKDKPLRDQLVDAVYRHVSKYFGNYEGDKSTDIANQNFYADHNSDERVGVSEFKGKRIGVCAEKAGLAQNLFVIAGIDSRMVPGNLSVEGQPSDNMHWFNIITTEKGNYLVDVTNPVEVTKDGKAINYLPSIYPISQEQMQGFDQGQSIEVTHTDYELGDDNNYNPKQTHLTYS